MDTYRYHGHSMSDPGITYRSRDEVAGVRQARDPVATVKGWLLNEAGCAEDEIKVLEKKACCRPLPTRHSPPTALHRHLPPPEPHPLCNGCRVL